MGDGGGGLIELTVFLGEGGGDFDEEGNFVNLESFLGEGQHSFKFADIIFHRGDAVKGVFGNLGVFFSLEPLLHDEGSMGDGSAHILDGGAEGQSDLAGF
jgi:hypothetical protein